MPRSPLLLLLLLVCCAPKQSEVCERVAGRMWKVPALLRPVLNVEAGACMVLHEGELIAADASGRMYDPVAATCSEGTIRVDGHGQFLLAEEYGEVSVWSRKYLVSLDLEPCEAGT